MLHHVYLHHGSQAGLVFIDSFQRMTTSLSMYTYCHSIGLDDCWLPTHTSTNARAIIRGQVAATPQRAVTKMNVPYRVDEDEHTVSRLIGIRAKSEEYVVNAVVRPRRRHITSSDGDVVSTTMSDSNQIAILTMLGTKGSISNLVQCTHALGQQIIHESHIPTADFGRVFPHDQKNQPTLESQGLLHSESFIEGLSPIAFFIHADRMDTHLKKSFHTHPLQVERPSSKVRHQRHKVDILCG